MQQGNNTENVVKKYKIQRSFLFVKQLEDALNQGGQGGESVSE